MINSFCKHFCEKIKTYFCIHDFKISAGNGHIILNHAVMVMAWTYGQNDFHKSFSIVNTAGWDTDCNSANVGSAAALCICFGHFAVESDIVDAW